MSDSERLDDIPLDDLEKGSLHDFLSGKHGMNGAGRPRAIACSKDSQITVKVLRKF